MMAAGSTLYMEVELFEALFVELPNRASIHSNVMANDRRDPVVIAPIYLL